MEHPDNRQQLVQANLPALNASRAADRHHELANHLYFSWFGVNPGALRGVPVREVIGADAYAVLKPHYEEALGGRTSTFMGEVPYAAGGRRFIHGTAVPLIAGGGDVNGVLALATDLTEHKLIEQALDAATLRGQTVLDTAVDGIVTIDENGVMQSCNTSVQRQFGFRTDELIGRNVSMLMPSPDAENHDAYLQRYLKTGEKHIIGIGREVTGRRKDGSEFPMELAVGEFVEDGRHYFTGFIRDVTDRKLAEWEARTHLNELAHVTRLSTIHNLASGLAHEINQPLTAVVTMAQALLRAQRAGRLEPAALESALEKIVRQGVRAGSIIQQMRDFIGKGETEAPSPQVIDDIISGVLQLLEHEIEQNGVRIDARFNTGSTSISVNRIQIEQVVLNLLQNAIEAMAGEEGERVLTIRTHGPRRDPPCLE
ncbi:MAG: PAS domain S-box protein, partial [Gammaproteobacteria bacterium]